MNDNISALTRRLELENVSFSTDDKSLFDASLDHMRYSFLPDVVAYAECGEDIGKVLKTANELDVPVTVRGCGTGCSGGSVPTPGGIVLDLGAIDFIEIDPVARVAHVGAGAVTANVDAAAQKHGLFYAPDPSSHKYSSIGGNIACNAGGLRALKYGVTRDNVIALTAYLPNGEKLKCGLPVKKFSVGPNLRDFFIGSEGTFGVVSEAWLKLLPLPQSKKVAIAFFDGDEQAFEGIEKIMRSALQPSILEFMDADTIGCVRVKEPSLEIGEGKSAVLAEFDGFEPEAEASVDMFFEVLAGCEVRRAKDAAEAEKLWSVRRKASPAMYMLGDSKISQDIVLPFDGVAEFFRFYKKLGRELNLATPVFGHAGDGNYHIHFMYNGAEDGARARAVRGMDLSIKKTIELGGAVSGEHGIGFLKSKYMPLQHGKAELELMRSLKKVFDPKDILNRGKIYEVTDTSGMQPLRGVKLPWD